MCFPFMVFFRTQVRRATLRGDVVGARRGLGELKETGELYALPAALEGELGLIRGELMYLECMGGLRGVLGVQGAAAYLVPVNVNRTRKRTSSQHRITATGGDEMEEVLAEDGLMPNEVLLDTHELDRVLRMVQAAQDVLQGGGEELPSDLADLQRAAEGVRSLRRAVGGGDWEQARAVLGEIHRDGLVSRVPLIEAEVAGNMEHVANYAVVSACRGALSKGSPQGPIGLLDYSKVAVEQLEEAAKLCQGGCPSPRAAELYSALLIVLDLRRAQRLGDWGAIHTALDKAEAGAVGSGGTSFLLGEINRSCIERDNHLHIGALRGALVDEELQTRTSLLDLDHASINSLAAVYSRASLFPEDTRGVMLKALLTLAEVGLKSRRAAIQKQWFLLQSLIPVLRDSLECFQNEMEKCDQRGRMGAGGGFRSSLFRPSMRAPTHSVSVSGGMGGQGGGGGGVADAEGLVGAAVKSAMWSDFGPLLEVLKREIGAIETHFSVLQLQEAFDKALRADGIQSVQSEVVGEIDKKGIKTEALEGVLGRLREMEGGEGGGSAGVLPEALYGMARTAHVVLDLRTAVLGDRWDDISALLEETLNGGLGMGDYTRGEIQVVRREVEHRWIVTNLTAALQQGRLEGELGNVNLRGVSCEHLTSYISTARSLNPRTEFAVLLLHTAEVIHPLRKLLCAGAVDWAGVEKSAKRRCRGRKYTPRCCPNCV
ncbi:hypothetical protein B484DRAFT_80698 [Ochromonadaceae sp. CCMP2298]|nr:hypothetical protein B484DRAFT_80698 [Ochromonadaceae sp. CCMP2298]